MDKIDSTLMDFGISPGLKGYGILHSAIDIAIRNPKATEKMMVLIYQAVAEKHGTTATRAERVIRHAVEAGFDRCDNEEIVRYFGKMVSKESGRVTNRDFISIVAMHLR